MVEAIQNILRRYHTLLNDYADPRTKDWFLATSPVTTLVIIASYLYFCTIAGPRFMEGRKPFKLKNTLIVYNAFQVLFSIFLVYQGLSNGWSGEYNWFCQPIDTSNSPTALGMASAVWFYYIAKLTELLDTVFFVLRKKYNQITFLHIYHHASMPLFTWIGVRYFAGGHGTMFGLINSFVHVIMYTYYLIAGLGPQYQKYLWWKKHITILQLVQFMIIFCHNFFVIFSDCKYPKFLHVLLVCNSTLFIYLFGKFYIKSYNRPKTKSSLNRNGNANKID